MSEALGKIVPAITGGTGGNIAKLIQLVTGGAGAVGNILQSRSAANRQAFLDSIAKNPAKLAALINAAKQPLSQGLVQGVTNTTQANLAERGLSSSPQIAAAVESQALAPYELKSQEDAQNAVLQALGIDVGGAHALPGGPSDTSSFWKMFTPQPTPSSGGGGGGSISTYPSPSDTSGGGGGGGGTDTGYPPPFVQPEPDYSGGGGGSFPF